MNTTETFITYRDIEEIIELRGSDAITALDLDSACDIEWDHRLMKSPPGARDTFRVWLSMLTGDVFAEHVSVVSDAAPPVARGQVLLIGTVPARLMEKYNDPVIATCELFGPSFIPMQNRPLSWFAERLGGQIADDR